MSGIAFKNRVSYLSTKQVSSKAWRGFPRPPVHWRYPRACFMSGKLYQSSEGSTRGKDLFGFPRLPLLGCCLIWPSWWVYSSVFSLTCISLMIRWTSRCFPVAIWTSDYLVGRNIHSRHLPIFELVTAEFYKPRITPPRYMPLAKPPLPFCRPSPKNSHAVLFMYFSPLLPINGHSQDMAKSKVMMVLPSSLKLCSFRGSYT